MAAGFRALGARLRRDEKDLHDFLWAPVWAGDADALRRALERDARDLDAFLGARGLLRRNAIALLRSWDREADRVHLFELLSHTFYLASARERAARGDFAGSGEDLRDVVGSVSIGTCSAAGCFDLVQEWEGGKTTFEVYTGKLADVLESKGVAAAGAFKRMLNAAWSMSEVAAAAASKEERALASRAALASAAWCAAAVVAVRGGLSPLPDVPFRDIPRIVAIASAP